MASSNLAAGQLNSMSRAQLTQAVRQVLDSKNFWDRNHHVPVNQRQAVRGNILNGNWPNYPIFSPYAATHDGYSQSKESPSLYFRQA